MYDAGKKFDLLNAVNEETLVKVICNGHAEIPQDVVVGDIVVLETGEEFRRTVNCWKPFPLQGTNRPDR